MLTLEEQLTIIKKAKQKIYLKKNWTQEAFARDKDGRAVKAANKDAVCWCALGAVYCQVIDQQHRITLSSTIIERSSIVQKSCGLGTVNDILGHKHVIRVFNEVIKSIEQELKNKEQDHAE